MLYITKKDYRGHSITGNILRTHFCCDMYSRIIYKARYNIDTYAKSNMRLIKIDRCGIRRRPKTNDSSQP